MGYIRRPRTRAWIFNAARAPRTIKKMAHVMMTPWVLKNPPKWLSANAVQYALHRCGYTQFKIFCFDLREVPTGPVRDCIVIVPERVCDVWGWASFTPHNDNVRYVNIRYRGPAESAPYTYYRIAGLPQLPREVLNVALEVSRQRPRPPPTPWQRGLGFLAQARRLAP